MSEDRYREEYVRRIHKVQDYIERHIGRSFSVEELSEVAGFSMYHFSRIFQGVLQESLIHYVNRIRMEQALFMLAHRQDCNMTDIALELGFSDSAVFSRAFRNCYGVSPREYRQEYSKNCKESILLSAYNGNTARKEADVQRLPLQTQVTIEERREQPVVYVRHMGTYQTLAEDFPQLIDVLFEQADKQQLLAEGQNQVLAIYHDNPEFTDEKNFRTSLCLTVPGIVQKAESSLKFAEHQSEARPPMESPEKKNANIQYPQIQEDGVLGQMMLEGGLYAVGHFQICQEQYHDAWDYMYQEWLSCSGYVPRNSYPFEMYMNAPATEEKPIHRVDIYVPVEPILLP